MACREQHKPAAEFEHAQRLFWHGDLIQAQSESEKGYRYYSGRDPLWAWKFRLLSARVLNWRGMNSAVLSVLNPKLPSPFHGSDVEFQKQQLEGLTYARQHRFREAEQKLTQATHDCFIANCKLMGELFAAEGFLAIEQGRYEEARELFAKNLQFARQRKDHFLEAMALLELSNAELLRTRFDEAIDWSHAAYDAAAAIDAELIEEIALGNLGWAYYKTGDSERALDFFRKAEDQAKKLGSLMDEARWLATTGDIYASQGKFTAAEDSYKEALDLANRTDNKEEVLDVAVALAFAAVQNGQLELARQYSQTALDLASAGSNQMDRLYALLATGEVASRNDNEPLAEKIFSEVADSPNGRLSLKWEAQHELANLYAKQDRAMDADKTYRAALSTFESARAQLQHEDLKLPFLGNAAHLYDDYVHFLIEQGKPREALRVADFSRAQTLAEVLGTLDKDSSFDPAAVHAPELARRLKSAILFYWLGPKQSYLWAITANGTGLFQLPPAAQIDDLVKRYRDSLIGPRDPLAMSDPDGIELYKTLVAPADKLLKHSSRVVVVPDGSLNNLNFETLLVPQPKLHYWIEDVTLSDASSLRMLAAAEKTPQNRGGKLLLIGDPVAPNAEYFELPKAATEVKDIEQHFTSSQEDVFTRAEATPEAYLTSKPGQFAYIHFVAHGTASRLSPLDSAVVLSKSTSDEDSFKLYAREIIREPLHARLVTISTCYGAGSRAYTGEGLVGLSWAFLRAGAHNVIGALWEVSDTSTPQLMNTLYGDLRKGESPEEALRNAKLSLLHSDSVFRKPFYWAPFQLYSGS